MERRTTIKILAIASAVIPFVIICLSHTFLWPETFAAHTDTYTPQGPTTVFNDFTPGNRTDVLSEFEGVQVRPIIDGPVYLLFQPRRHTAFIDVEVRARPSFEDEHLVTDLLLGYRHGDGPEDNILHSVAARIENGWYVWRGTLPLTEMTKERVDARRIVMQFAHDHEHDNEIHVEQSWNVKSVRVFYQD